MGMSEEAKAALFDGTDPIISNENLDVLLDALHELKPMVLYKATTGSVYVKFDVEGVGSLRIADHPGKKGYKYRWNLRADMEGQSTSSPPSGTHKRFFYGFDSIGEMVAEMLIYKKASDAFLKCNSPWGKSKKG
jgi:hypothetical protein